MKKNKITKALLSPCLSQNIAQAISGLQIAFGAIVNIVDVFAEEDYTISAIAPRKSKKEWQDD